MFIGIIYELIDWRKCQTVKQYDSGAKKRVFIDFWMNVRDYCLFDEELEDSQKQK